MDLGHMNVVLKWMKLHVGSVCVLLCFIKQCIEELEWLLLLMICLSFFLGVRKPNLIITALNQ